MKPERLQKILARAGVGSRRAVEEMIRAGRVTVNGAVAGLGDKADPASDAIKVDGKRVHPPSADKTYLLLNKPRGVMSTTSDPEGRPTVMELVPPALRKALVPVGRLDFQTEGLLLLTDDGDLAHRVAHPRYGCTKTYEVKVKGRPEPKELDRLRAGILLEGRRTAPCEIEERRAPAGPRAASTASWWRIELAEGRTRQIREMFFRIGHPVQRLRRVSIGPLTDRSLPIGKVRALTVGELELLRRRVGLASPRGRSRKAKKATPARRPAHAAGKADGARRGPGAPRGKKR